MNNIKLVRPKSAKQLERPWGAETALGNSRRWKYETKQHIGEPIVTLPIGVIGRIPTLDMGQESMHSSKAAYSTGTGTGTGLKSTHGEHNMLPILTLDTSPQSQSQSQSQQRDSRIRRRRRPMTGITRKENEGSETGAVMPSWSVNLSTEMMSLQEMTTNGYGNGNGNDQAQAYANDDDDAIRTINNRGGVTSITSTNTHAFTEHQHQNQQQHDRVPMLSVSQTSFISTSMSNDNIKNSNANVSSSSNGNGNGYGNELGKRMLKLSRNTMELTPRDDCYRDCDGYFDNRKGSEEKVEDRSGYQRNRRGMYSGATTTTSRVPGTADSQGSQVVNRRLRSELDALVPIHCQVVSSTNTFVTPEKERRNVRNNIEDVIPSLFGDTSFEVYCGTPALANASTLSATALIVENKKQEEENNTGNNLSVSPLPLLQYLEKDWTDADVLNLSGSFDSSINLQIDSLSPSQSLLTYNSGSESGGFQSISSCSRRTSYGHTTVGDDSFESLDSYDTGAGAVAIITSVSTVSPARLRSFKKKPRVLAAIEQQEYYKEMGDDLITPMDRPDNTIDNYNNQHNKRSIIASANKLPECDYAIIQKNDTSDVCYASSTNLGR